MNLNGFNAECKALNSECCNLYFVSSAEAEWKSSDNSSPERDSVFLIPFIYKVYPAPKGECPKVDGRELTPPLTKGLHRSLAA